MSDRHFHAWFIPGESYLSTAARHYLGYMLSPDGPVSTETQIEVAGSGLPNTSDDWKDFVGGKGHVISKSLKMAIMSYMVDTANGKLFAAYLLTIGEELTIEGVVCTQVWIESLTVNLETQGIALKGKIVTFSDGSITTVAMDATVPSTMPTREPDTDLYAMYVVGHIESTISGPVRVGIARILPAEEIWFESYFTTMLSDHGGVGLLLIKYGLRDAVTDDVVPSYCTQWYRCRIARIALKNKYGNAPYLTYDMPVECAIYDPTNEDSDTPMSYTKPTAPANVVAGQNAYADAILVTWDAVVGASRYQVYCSTSATAPTCVEQHPTCRKINEVSDGGDGNALTLTTDTAHGLVEGDKIYVRFAATYSHGPYVCLEGTTGSTIEILGLEPFSVTAAGLISACVFPLETNGLLAEIPAQAFLAFWNGIAQNDPQTMECLGIIHGTFRVVSTKNYLSTAITNAGAGDGLTFETHMYYWVRARVGGDGASTDEWTALSVCAHGCTLLNDTP